MTSDHQPGGTPRLSPEQLAAVRRQRDELMDQVRRSQETIARSQEIIRRLDAVLAQSGEHD